MKRSAIIFFLLISFIAGTLWYGKTLPDMSHISASQTFNREPAYIWALIFDFNHYAEWREDVYEVTQIPDTDGFSAWREVNGEGTTALFEQVSLKKNKYIIIKETPDTHKNVGTWQFKVTPADDGKSSTLQIIEDRDFPDLVLRVINNLLNTSTSHIDAYFRSINNKIINDTNRIKRLESEKINNASVSGASIAEE